MDSNVDVSVIKNWEVNSNTSDFTLQRIVEQIEDGNNSQGGINLKPFYQREYKFTRKDESLLIESLLGGIPIPIIYLASDTSKIPHVSNVIDGQHRLMAVYRFLNNKFRLTGLEKFKELNDRFFYELHPTIQNKLKFQISLSLQFIHVQDDPELEIEIFTRYNQGTNPLTAQEIRHVVLGSPYNDWVVEHVNELMKDGISKDIYNITKKRFDDKTIHQELYVLFCIYKNLSSPNFSITNKDKLPILKNGINQEYYSSTKYVVELMAFARNLNKEESEALIKESREFFLSFTKFLRSVFYDKGTKFPLSKEVYGTVKVRNHKMQTSILMIMASIFFNIAQLNIQYDDSESQNILRAKIAKGFQNSKFPDVTTSTTEPKFLSTTIDTILESVL